MTTPKDIIAIDRARLGTVVGGNLVTGVADTVAPMFNSDWKKLDCVTRASIVSEVGEAAGAIGGMGAAYYATHKMAGGKHAFLATLGAFAVGKVSEGFSRQYTFAKYNEACKGKK